MDFARRGCLAGLGDCGSTLLQGGGLRVATTVLGILGPPTCPVGRRMTDHGGVMVVTTTNDFVFFMTLFLLVRTVSHALHSSAHAHGRANDVMLKTCPTPLGLDPVDGRYRRVTAHCVDDTVLQFFARQGRNVPFVLGLLDARRNDNGACLTRRLRKC